MRVAAISDVHGNIAALETVLTDIATRRVDLIVNLGDVLSGPLCPCECADRLIPLGFPTIRGNHERQLLTLKPEEMGLSDRFTASCLGPRHFQWIAGFPDSLSPLDGMLMVHGTPQSDLGYFLESVDKNGARTATLDEVRSRAAGSAAELILCGHTHQQRIVALTEGCMIVNPGSVGLPAYRDEHPFPHKIESGSPHARYAIIEKRKKQWSAEMIAVPYEWETTAALAEERGRSDWAQALLTGYVD